MYIQMQSRKAGVMADPAIIIIIVGD